MAAPASSDSGVVLGGRLVSRRATVRQRDSKRGQRRTLGDRAPSLISVAVLVVAWAVIGALGHVSFIPSIPEIARAMGGLITNGELYHQGMRTLYAIGEGLAIAVVAGAVVGVAMGRSRVAERVLGLYVNVGQSLPMAAIVPILVLVFGLGEGSIVVTVVLFAVFSVAVNVYAGVRNVDPNLVEMARSFGAREHTILLRVALPAALPLTFTGLRIAVGRAVDGAILGEMLVSLVGLGGSLMTYGSSFQLAYVYALLIYIFVLGRLAMLAVTVIGRAVQPWAP